MMLNRADKYAAALQKAAADLRRRAPLRVARGSGCAFTGQDDQGAFHLPFWGQDLVVTYPDAQVRLAVSGGELTVTEQLLALHYLATADGMPLQGRWVAFRELPHALMYDPAFQGDTQPPIAYTYARHKAAFQRACRSLGGEPLPYGDAAFRFQVFPRLPVAVTLRLADDEFPADARVLFDPSATHYLPVEDLAVLGGLMAQRLAQARSAPAD